jgi:hypothetical protein
VSGRGGSTTSNTTTEVAATNRDVSKVNKAMNRFVENDDSIFKPDLKFTSKHHNDVVSESQIGTSVLNSNSDEQV